MVKCVFNTVPADDLATSSQKNGVGRPQKMYNLTLKTPRVSQILLRHLE